MARKTIVLITNADSDVGYRRARELVADGHRVVITARHASRLSRILLGQNADHVMAIAADLTDPVQRSQMLQRADARLGRIRWILDGRTGSATALTASDNDFPMSATVEYPVLSRAS